MKSATSLSFTPIQHEATNRVDSSWNKGQIEKDSPPLCLLVTQSAKGANSPNSRRIPFHEGGKGWSSFLDEIQRGVAILVHRGGKGENVAFVIPR